MNFAFNVDILSVGIAIAANLILGTIILFQNTKSATSKLFFAQAVILSIWSFVNYISYQAINLDLTLWLVRLVLFFAVPNSIIFVLLMYTFPKEKWVVSKNYTLIAITLSVCTMILTLSPYVFSGIEKIPGVVARQPIVGPGILVFLFIGVCSIPVGIFFIVKKFFKSVGKEKDQIKLLLFGVITMFSCIIVFNFIFPVFFNSTRFIPLSALFTFPFVAFTSYAIYKHNLFNVKAATTGLLTFALSVVTFIEIIFSENFSQVIFRSSIFILVLIVGITLIKGVLREVRQREKVQKLASDLEKANAKLRELDQMKSEFISLATHQIRAPLTAIKGYASLVLEGDFGPVTDSVKGAVTTIFQSCDNLVTIVSDFLDVSRIEQGRMKYDFTDFDISKLTEQIVSELKPNIEKAGLTFSYNAEAGKGYMVHADQGKIKQIIGNIVDNSIKYTPKGSVDISISRTDKNVRIKVKDTGVGIKPEEISSLFEKFVRAKDAVKTNVTGTGLGLYIARQMIEAHKGRIWAESEGLKKGSTFIIELPVK